MRRGVAGDGDSGDDSGILPADRVFRVEDPAIEDGELIAVAITALDTHGDRTFLTGLPCQKFGIILKEILDIHGGLERTKLDAAGPDMTHARILPGAITRQGDGGGLDAPGWRLTKNGTAQEATDDIHQRTGSRCIDGAGDIHRGDGHVRADEINLDGRHLTLLQLDLYLIDHAAGKNLPLASKFFRIA